jgi:hypothetical protein
MAVPLDQQLSFSAQPPLRSRARTKAGDDVALSQAISFYASCDMY